MSVELTHRRKMIRLLIGKIFSRLPISMKTNIRAHRIEYLVRRGRMYSDEIEYRRLGEWLRADDTAIDIGANFGAYTIQMSRLVGPKGRVFSFEPVPQTFSMLTRAVAAAGRRNVTLLNLACSNQCSIDRIYVPADPVTGENLYQSSMEFHRGSPIDICAVRLDDLKLPLGRLRLVKIDAEGHESSILDGMWQSIERSRPVLIIENLPVDAANRLASVGYQREHESGSPNSVFHPNN